MPLKKSINTGRYAVDLLAHTCSFGWVQHDDVLCGNVTAMITMPPAVVPVALYAVAYNLTVPAFRVNYAVPMPPVEITGLQPRNDMLYRSPLIKKARGRPQVACLTAGDREYELPLSMGPCRTSRTVYSAASAVTKKDRKSYAVEPSLRLQTFKCCGGLCGSRWDGWSSGGFLFIQMVYFCFNSVLLGAAIWYKHDFRQLFYCGIEGLRAYQINTLLKKQL